MQPCCIRIGVPYLFDADPHTTDYKPEQRFHRHRIIELNGRLFPQFCLQAEAALRCNSVQSAPIRALLEDPYWRSALFETTYWLEPHGFETFGGPGSTRSADLGTQNA